MSESKSGKAAPAEEEEVKAADFSLLEKAAAFCESPRFSSAVQAFVEKYVHHFSISDKDNDDDDDDAVNTLEHTAIFTEYTQLLEDGMESFLQREGFSQSEFFVQCSDVVDGKFTPLFEENEHQWFVDMLHSWTDYQAFRRFMAKEVRKRREARHK